MGLIIFSTPALGKQRILDHRTIDKLVREGEDMLLSDPNKAENKAEAALKASQTSNYSNGIIRSSYLLGQIFAKRGKEKRAIRYIEPGVETANRINDRAALLEGYQKLQDYYRASKNDSKVREYRKLYNDLETRIELEAANEEKNRIERALYELDSLSKKQSSGAKIKLDSLVGQVQNLSQKYELDGLERMTIGIQEAMATQQKLEKTERRYKTFLLVLASLIILILTGFLVNNAYKRQRLAKANRELEHLRLELNHRVKNSLLTISSQLHLQLDSPHIAANKEMTLVLNGVIDRIQAVQLLHKHLQHNNSTNTVDFKEYLVSLSRHIRESGHYQDQQFYSNFDLSSVPPVQLARAGRIGAAITELAINALKYASDEDKYLAISGGIKQQTEELELIVEDRGPGMTNDYPPGSGLKMARAVIEKQLKGHFVLGKPDTGKGTLWKMIIPLKMLFEPEPELT